MKQAAVRLVNAVNRALARNPVLRAVVAFQHRHAPLPVGAYAWLFRSRVRSELLGWYANHVFHAGFDRRRSNFDYWQSEESLYWYLGVARHQVKRREIDALFAIAEVAGTLRAPGLSVLDIGCGVMKEEAYMVRAKGFLPARITGIDLNPHIAAHAFADPRIETRVIAGDVAGIDIAALAPDVIFLFGGVIEFLPFEFAKRIFTEGLACGTRLIVILGEGTCGAGGESAAADHREDSFVFSHDISAILRDLGDPQKALHVGRRPDGGIDYLAVAF